MFPPNPRPGDQYKQWTWDGCRWTCGGVDGGGGGAPGGTFVGPNPPAGPQSGQMWLNTGTNQLFVYDGTQWLAAAPTGVTVADTAPASPSVGDFWFSTAANNLYVYDGSSWVLSSSVAPTIISATAPTSPFPGELWHNLTDNALYVYDGATSAWILAHPLSTTSGPNPPANPTPGDMWWSTSDDQMSIFDGTNWIAMIGTPQAGSITYVQATAPTGAETGALWWDTSNNELFIWDGSAWQEAQGISGPQGVPGPPGAAFPDAPSDGKWYGRMNAAWTSGGVVNATTRSGSNTFHGDAYEFLRNSALDARNFFDRTTLPPFKRNQFGAALGGPIRPDHTFFFVNYEGIRQSKGTTTISTVPTEDARNGIEAAKLDERVGIHDRNSAVVDVRDIHAAASRVDCDPLGRQADDPLANRAVGPNARDRPCAVDVAITRKERMRDRVERNFVGERNAGERRHFPRLQRRNRRQCAVRCGGGDRAGGIDCDVARRTADAQGRAHREWRRVIV